jgi:precorrin-6A synthase
MRTVLVIGIGAGDPEYVTVQAIRALNTVDVFFLIDKGRQKQDLVRLRKEICDRYIENRTYRTVEVHDPPRDRAAAEYRPAVEAWRRSRLDLYEALIRDELAEDECGAFLVWGDPSLYDGTLEIVGEILARGSLQFEYRVIPGISSVQALAARHKIALNRVGQPVHVTTGRRLAEGFPDNADDVVVLLDADCTFNEVAAPDDTIYWGAYLGTEDEILVAGELHDVAAEIQAVRRAARERKGWIMDVYLLRRTRR